MKDFQTATDLEAAAAAGDDYLHLYPVLKVTSTGRPVLAGVETDSVVPLVSTPADIAGGLAVCRPFGGDKIAILGFLRGAAVPDAPEGDHDWLELRHGKAAIRLCRDGRVRIEGTDILVNSEGAVALDGATVTLN